MSAKITKRESNFELLRIFAILIIILSHFNVHTFQPQFDANVFNPNFFLTVLFSLGGIGNILFMMITGYFMIKSEMKYQRIIALILEMYFYSITAYVVTLLIGKHSITGDELKQTLLPFLYGNWFCVGYILFCLFIPFINKLLNNLDKKQHLKLTVITLFVFSILPIFFKINYVSKISFFVMGYLLGSYIKLYAGKVKNWKLYTAFICTFLLMSIFTFLRYCNILGNNAEFTFSNVEYYIVNTCSPFIIALGTIIFLRFKNIKLENNFVNTIAKSSLGVYLIHDNVFVRGMIWRRFNDVNLITMPIYQHLIYAILSVAVIFISCTIIDLIRRKLFGKLEDKLAEKFYNFFISLYKKCDNQDYANK